MRFHRQRDLQGIQRSIYLQVSPYLGIFGMGLLVAALLVPSAYGVATRWQLLPLFLAGFSNIGYMIAMRRRELPAWVDRVRMAFTAILYLAFFWQVDPCKSDLWLILLLPFLGQASSVRNGKELNFRMMAFAVVSMLSFAFHLPVGKPGLWEHVVDCLGELTALYCVAAYAWVARTFEHNQNRALLAAYNKLAQKQKQIAQTERFAALGEMSTGVAHEINNPLTVVVCGLDELTKFVTNREPSWMAMEKHLERMTRASVRIQRVVAQLRMLSRDSTKDPVHPFDLRRVVDDAFFLMKEQLATRNIVWEVELPQQEVRVLGHEGEICQVLLNLLNNARDALENHDGPRKLRVQLAPGPDRKAVLLVSDTGAGIPAEVQAKIYKPFVTTKPAGRGTGLGLSVSYGIIRRHRGTIAFESSTTQGTKFSIELPLASQAAAA